MTEPVQVGWAVLYRYENTDPDSENFGFVTEWWEVWDLNGATPEGVVPVYVHDLAEPQPWK